MKYIYFRKKFKRAAEEIILFYFGSKFWVLRQQKRISINIYNYYF